MRRLELELVIDSFAGGGGASLGIEQAIGRPVDIAINHDAEAIVAAYQLGRKAIGIELEEKWCETTVKRLEREMAQGRLFAAPPEQPKQATLGGMS